MQGHSFSTFNAFTTKAGNIIWGAAMQLAWNELRTSFASNSPLLFLTENATSLQTIKNFNEGTFSKADIDPQSYYVKSGYGQATVNTINSQLLKRFPEKTIAPLQEQLSDSDIISYAYLFKKIMFDVKFKRREDLFLFNGRKVDSFYGDMLKQKEQVLVHQYDSEHSFMVEIQGKNQKDSLFLIKNKGIRTVEDALKVTTEGTIKHPPPLKKDDLFEMPVIKLNASRNLEELIGLKFKNQQLSQYFIRKMYEQIKLNIDESGAKVENEAVIVASRCMVFNLEKKRIVLDQSFWVVMKQSGSNPYLCVFVNDPSDE